MEWFNTYVETACVDIRHSFGNSSSDVSENMSFINGERTTGLVCENIAEVCCIKTHNLNYGTAIDPNKIHGENVKIGNVPPLVNDNVHRLLVDNGVCIKSEMIQHRDSENVTNMDFKHSEEDDLEEGKMKMGHLQLLTNCGSTEYTTNILPTSREAGADANYQSTRTKPNHVTIIKSSNEDVNCKCIKVESVVDAVSEESEVNVIFRSKRTKSNSLPVSGDLDMVANSKSSRTKSAVLPASEESDVDLLYSYYTCVSPEIFEEKLFKEIKSEPWIQVSQGILPGDRVKEQDDAQMTQSPANSDREVMKQEYNKALFGVEQISRKDILCNPDQTSSPSPFLACIDDFNFSPNTFRKPRIPNEINNATWQPVVILQDVGINIPPNSVKREDTLSPAHLGPDNIQLCKNTLDCPDNIGVFSSKDSKHDKGHTLLSVSSDSLSLNKVIKYGRKRQMSVGKGRYCSPSVQGDGVKAADIALENNLYANGVAEKTSLTNAQIKTETITENGHNSSPPIPEIKVTTPDLILDNTIGDDVATVSPSESRPKRQSAMKAVGKLQEAIKDEDEEGNMRLFETSDTEDPDYYELHSDSEVTDSDNEVTASDDEIDVNYTIKKTNPPQTIVINRKKKIQFYKCNICTEEFLEEDTLKQHKSTCRQKEVKTKFFCEVCERYLESEGNYKRHNFKMHGKLPDKTKLKKCDICTKEFWDEDKLNKHLLYYHRKKIERMKYPCDICHHQFRLKGGMLRHKKIMHLQERRSVCEVCGQVFDNTSALAIHLSNHERRYQCHICSSFWSTNYNLKTHMLSHTGEKPHKCQVCQQAFSRIDNLKLHLKLMHKEVLRYECKTCGKKFKTNKEKLLHQKQDHPKKRMIQGSIPCKLCGKMLWKQRIESHVRLHKSGKIMQCEKCKKHVQITLTRYKYKIEEKDETTRTVCYACFEEYAKTFKPEDHLDLVRKCQLRVSCQYCGKSCIPRKTTCHEARCRVAILKNVLSLSEKVLEDGNMASHYMAVDDKPTADVQDTPDS